MNMTERLKLLNTELRKRTKITIDRPDINMNKAIKKSAESLQDYWKDNNIEKP